MLAFRYITFTLALSAIIALLTGSASAFFLISLEQVTAVRESSRWWYLSLPLVGFLIGWLYHDYGATSDKGNNLLIEEVHTPQARIPFRMAPLVLGATLLTHLAGGSAGREGTAVQMGGSLAFQLVRWLKPDGNLRRDILIAGMAGGFASVFGTPAAGAVFALEVIIVGRIRFDALLPAVLTAFLANEVCHLWGAEHTIYPKIAALTADGWMFLSLLVAAALFGLTARVFALTVDKIKHVFSHISWPPLRPTIGGIILAVVFLLFPGMDAFAGLGVPQIIASFTETRPVWFFVAKLLLTAFTLGVGFKGGEVTPLFFIGAALGSTLSRWLPVPAELLVACGFVAVFAAATNTPLASSLMGIELFGAETGIAMLMSCTIAYLVSGHGGIYGAQIIGSPKTHEHLHLKGKRLQDKKRA